MKLYIQIEGGHPVNHPALESNLLQAFGAIPDAWECFTRAECPTPGLYKRLESNEPVYAKVDGVWTDVWILRDMTAEEKITEQKRVISGFNTRDQSENWAAWTLDEVTCTMVPPISRPEPDQANLNQGIYTYWCGADTNWKDTPVRPEGDCKFNFITWRWVSFTIESLKSQGA